MSSSSKHLKKSIFVICLVLLISYLFYPRDRLKLKIQQVCFENNCFQVEIADTKIKREQGLMNRAELKGNMGMLFVFNEEKQYSFWMKNTLIPLDIIWLNNDKRVVYIINNIPACQTEPCPEYKPAQTAKYVLEVNQGIAQKNNLSIGDQVDFK